MSSFSLFLGGTPSTFKLSLEMIPQAEKCPKSVTAEVVWSETDAWDVVKTRLRECFVEFYVCERCEVEMEFAVEEVMVEICVQSNQPVVQSLTFARESGSGNCDERFLLQAFSDLDLTSVTRVSCHEGFPFFVPAIVPVSQWQSLRQLNLVNAGIMALPSVLGQYGSLREMRLSNNKLTALPRELGFLKNLQVLAADHNQLVSIPTDVCDCCNLQDLNFEFNNLSTLVLDLRKFPKLHSLQLYGNPLKYIPELSVCSELRSFSLMNLRVWSDATFSQFEVTIEGTTTLASGTKLNPLYSVIFSRSSSQHPLLAGALGHLAEFRSNCDAILEQPGAPLQQLILMALSPNSIVKEQAAKVIGLMVHKVKTAQTLIKNGILGAMFSVLDSERQQTQIYGLKALSMMAMTSDSIAVSLLVPQLIEKLRAFIDPTADTAVRHLALETLGNLSFADENKKAVLAVSGLKDTLRNLARGQPALIDHQSRQFACRCLAILGEHEAVEAIVGRTPIGNRGIRILSIDGGGMKGLAAVKMLQELEDRTGRRISDLFDLIGGTSSGSMLAVSLGILQFSLQQCDDIYKNLGYRVFNQAHEEDQTGWKDSLFRMYRSGQQGLRVVMAGCKHDASTFESLLQEMCGDLSDKSIGSLYIDSAVLPGPKVFAAATLTSIVPAVPFLFRNYELPVQKGDAKMRSSACLGSSKFDLWQGVRASSAAPYFFEDFKLDSLHFQDGATTANNPAVLAVQQAKLLWPDRPIDCIVSIGLGAVPAAQREKSSSSFLENGSVLIESCCSVERAHDVMTLMSGMMPEMHYFRFNPVDKRCGLGLDDLDPEKWSKHEAATVDYIKRNHSLFKKAAEILMTASGQPVRSLGRQDGLWIKKEGALIVLESETEKSPAIFSPLHYMEYCAGTVDVSKQKLWPCPSYKRDALFNEALNLNQQPAVSFNGTQLCVEWDLTLLSVGTQYLQHLSMQLSGSVGALHLDLEAVDCENLVLSWYQSIWSITDPSIPKIQPLTESRRASVSGPEAASLRSVLGIDQDQSLSKKIPFNSTFGYLGSTCRLISHQHLSTPVPSSIYIFERTEPKDTLQLNDIPSLAALVENVLITSAHHFADCLVGRFLNAGAKAVICPKKDANIQTHEALCFFKSLYDAVFSGQDVQSAHRDAESVLSHVDNVFMLFH